MGYLNQQKSSPAPSSDKENKISDKARKKSRAATSHVQCDKIVSRPSANQVQTPFLGTNADMQDPCFFFSCAASASSVSINDLRQIGDRERQRGGGGGLYGERVKDKTRGKRKTGPAKKTPGQP